MAKKAQRRQVMPKRDKYNISVPVVDVTPFSQLDNICFSELYLSEFDEVQQGVTLPAYS
jgi:hypothetical protein